MSVNIGPNEYTIKITARGKTKRLIDSSHQHPTTNMMQPTTKEVVEKLVEPFKIQVEWKAEVSSSTRCAFVTARGWWTSCTGSRPRIATSCTRRRDGKLRVTDGVGSASGGGGDALILGQNILTFSAEQSEDKAKSKSRSRASAPRRRNGARKRC